MTEGNNLENEFPMPATGEADHAHHQQDQFEHGLIPAAIASEINTCAGRTELCERHPNTTLSLHRVPEGIGE
jgi:hypothetical protein